MNIELLDRHQRQILAKEVVSFNAIEYVFSELISSEKDYTLFIKHETGELMYIAVDRDMETLFVQLREDEFYDYVSSTNLQGEIKFIQGGQEIKLDTRYIAHRDSTMKAIKNFLRNPGLVRTSTEWELQI